MAIAVSSFGDEAPSGENLEYDPAFTALEIAAQPGEERQRGDEIIAAEEPDYKDVIAKAQEVLGRSHDLRAAIYLAQAELRRNGLEGFAEATGYIRACLSDFWDSCHPQLDAEDDNDPTMRVNAVRGLAAPETILHALRIAPMTASRSFGRITLRDMMLMDGEIAPHSGEAVPDASSVAAAFKDTDPEALGAFLAAARQAEADVNEIDRIFNERVPGQGPDLSELQKALKRIVARLASELPEEVEAPAAEETDAWGTPVASGAAAPATAPAGGGIGGIASPQDVRNALDRIIGYYEAAEPSSPVPIFLKRAKRLVGANFMTIMNDMAPSGVDSVKHLGGITDAGGGESWGEAPAPAPKKAEKSSDW